MRRPSTLHDPSIEERINHMKRIKFLVSIVVCLLFATCIARAQGVGASGDIKGTVTDPSGAVVTGATVTATDAEKGLKRTAVTGGSGEFQVANLPPAAYDVSVASK